MDGKIVLITGANSGIGFEASLKLARMGAEVVMVARDATKAERAVAEIKSRSGSQKVSCLLCDFASQTAIRALASAFSAKFLRLDVLINNAGSVNDHRQLTSDGIEQTFAVNHLGYFLLSNLLLDLLKKSAPARVVNVSSIAQRDGVIDFDNLNYEHGGYSTMKAYARSKLSNVLFTRELARRLAGTGVTVNCLHPGTVATNIWAHAPWFARPFLKAAKLFMISAEQGGDRIVYLATSPAVDGESGGYYEKDRRVEPSLLARDEKLARKLCDVSAQLVKL